MSNSSVKSTMMLARGLWSSFLSSSSCSALRKHRRVSAPQGFHVPGALCTPWGAAASSQMPLLWLPCQVTGALLQEGELLTESLIAQIKAPHSTAAWPVSLAKFEGTSETGSAAFFQSPWILLRMLGESSQPVFLGTNLSHLQEKIRAVPLSATVC